MAELSERLPQNAAGRFYVDSTCIDCDACRQVAPDMFVRDDDSGHTYVVHQPADADEEALAIEAADSCPTCSIGSDGDQA